MQKGYSVSSIMDDEALRAMFKATIKQYGINQVKTQPFTHYFGIDANAANSLIVEEDLDSETLTCILNKRNGLKRRHYVTLHKCDFVRWVYFLPPDIVSIEKQKQYKEFRRLLLQYFFFGLQFRLFKKPKNAALISKIEEVWRKKYGMHS